MNYTVFITSLLLILKGQLAQRFCSKSIAMPLLRHRDACILHYSNGVILSVVASSAYKRTCSLKALQIEHGSRDNIQR